MFLRDEVEDVPDHLAALLPRLLVVRVPEEMFDDGSVLRAREGIRAGLQERLHLREVTVEGRARENGGITAGAVRRETSVEQELRQLDRCAAERRALRARRLLRAA